MYFKEIYWRQMKEPETKTPDWRRDECIKHRAPGKEHAREGRAAPPHQDGEASYVHMWSQTTPQLPALCL